jgi:hypothetical protein
VNVVHEYKVKCNVIIDDIGLRICRGVGKAQCILNVSDLYR